MFFFFFKQKTAYEMRISDWSSDVCSSDLFERGTDDAEVERRLGITKPHQNRLDLIINVSGHSGLEYRVLSQSSRALEGLVFLFAQHRDQTVECGLLIGRQLRNRLRSCRIPDSFVEIGRATCRE